MKTRVSVEYFVSYFSLQKDIKGLKKKFGAETFLKLAMQYYIYLRHE